MLSLLISDIFLFEHGFSPLHSCSPSSQSVSEVITSQLTSYSIIMESIAISQIQSLNDGKMSCKTGSCCLNSNQWQLSEAEQVIRQFCRAKLIFGVVLLKALELPQR